MRETDGKRIRVVHGESQRPADQAMHEQSMLPRRDIGHATVVALEHQAVGRDNSVQALQWRKARGGGGVDASGEWDAHDCRLVRRGLTIGWAQNGPALGPHPRRHQICRAGIAVGRRGTRSEWNNARSCQARGAPEEPAPIAQRRWQRFRGVAHACVPQVLACPMDDAPVTARLNIAGGRFDATLLLRPVHCSNNQGAGEGYFDLRDRRVPTPQASA